MIHSALPLATLALSLTLFLQAPIDGDWTLTIETPMGALDSKLVFKTSGEEVTGTMGDPMGGADVPIKGTIKGNQLTFTVTINAPPGPIDLEMRGEVSGDAIKGSFSGGPASGSFTARRGA